MFNERDGRMVELESLSSEMFSPLSEHEASLVVGGDIYYLGPTILITREPVIVIGDGWVGVGTLTTVEADDAYLITS